QTHCLATECSNARTDLCTASKLLDIAGIRAQAARVQAPDGFDYTVPRQSAATNVALAEDAALLASRIMEEASTALGGGMGLHEPLHCDPGELAESLNGTTAGVAWAHDFVDGYHLFREAIDLAVDSTLASADAQRAAPSLSAQIGQAVAGEELSRVA